MSATPNIPSKPYFRVTEVCQLTDTQPYVLRFWESEFPQLAPDRGQGGKSVYKKDDIELIFRIKRLLYEEEYTIAGARQVLTDEGVAPAQPTKRKTAATPVAKIVNEDLDESEPTESLPQQLELDSAAPPRPIAVPDIELDPEPKGVSKERYDDAVEEITHLRLQLQELEGRLRRADHDRDKAVEDAELMRDRRDRAIGRLESILGRLTGQADAPA